MTDEANAENTPPPSDPAAEDEPAVTGDAAPADSGWMRRTLRKWVAIRSETPRWLAVVLGFLCVLACLAVWWYVTRGEYEERILTSDKVPSPRETFSTFSDLWFERELTRNILKTMQRVILGFGLAAIVGVPVGVLAGCFSRIAAFLQPLIIFGRNIPLAALIPLTIFMFGIGELRTVLFIFIACVAFVIADTASSIADVSSRYIDTAYTLGAKRRHVIMKVLVPLAMPSIFNSLRLLFGLAFGYIMLAELFVIGGEVGGLGYLIAVSQRRGPREHIYLIILIIPLIALAIDRLLYWLQCQLFPYRYGGPGFLNKGLHLVLNVWEDFKRLFWKPKYDTELLEVSQPETVDKPQ